ncbi:ATPase [Loktanella sp. 1ANDIMAR09]|nr:ATPase [Loktanella sp. 1ANDIMAR09]
MTEWIKITRTFDAPIEEVWSMWADAANFQKWYGPRGFSVPVAEMDVTVGGTRKINMEMKTPDRTMSMWFTGQYKEVSAPHKLVYTESMCDPDGNLISPSAMGMPEGTPEVTEITVELTEEDGKTLMVMTHAGIPAGTPGEGGWMQAFDKMGEVLG